MPLTSPSLITFPHDPATTADVKVAGTFSKWEPVDMIFDESTNKWYLDLRQYLTSETSQSEAEIKGAKFMYKFILNGDNWCCNVLEPTVKDESGNDNHEITIDEDSDEEEASPPSSVQSTPEHGTKSSSKDADAQEDVDDVESIDDVAVAEQVQGFLGFLHWLWELILIRVFGRELDGSPVVSAAAAADQTSGDTANSPT